MNDKFTYTKTVLITVLMFFFLIVLGGSAGFPRATAFASSEKVNSNILSELQKDTKFKKADYPSIKNDYSLNVIQIAESLSGKLYVYVYNPSALTKPQTATDLNLSLSETATGTKLYSLSLIDKDGVFSKYCVNGVTVSSSATRYYNVTSIYRAWDKEIDQDTGNNNTISKKSYAVGKVYIATTENGVPKYFCLPTYTVNILEPYVDFLIYIETSTLPVKPVRPWLPSANSSAIIDSHYIAFSTDWNIEKLISADVHYYYKPAKGTFNTIFGSSDFGGNIEYGTEQDKTVTLNYDEKFEASGSGRFGEKYNYSWERIQTASDFLASEEKLTNETINNVKNCEWVLRFTETERTQKEINILGYTHYEVNYTKVDKVTVLRLEFETDGIVYNLGAVSDEQSGDGYPGNVEVEEDESFLEWLLRMLKKLFQLLKSAPYWVWIIIAVVVLAVLLPILSLIFPVTGTILKACISAVIWVIKAVITAVVWIVTLPFKAVSALIRALSRRGDK